MDEIEPFGAFDTDSKDDVSGSVTVKEGIDISDLREGHPTVFEVDPSSVKDEFSDPFNFSDVYKNLNYDCAVPEADCDDGLAPFERMAKGMVDLTDNGSVFKKILRPGTGGVVPEGSIVRVHYNGYLEYSDEPYDSSRLRNKQQQFRLGNGEVILGWDVAVATMKKSELARILVAPKYAFGSMGCPPRIPPNSTIMFEIELINFIDHKAADSYDFMSKDERMQLTLDDLIAVANAEREAGNDFFEQKQYGKANRKYSKAVSLLENSRLKNDEEEIRWKSVLLKLYLNVALCSLKVGKYPVAITNSRKALELDENNVKALFRIGEAHLHLSNFRRSREYYLRAGRLAPGSEDVRKALQKLDRVVRDFQMMERSMYSKMFGSETVKGKESSKDCKEVLKLLEERLGVFKNNHDMTELVLPLNLDADQIQCAEEVAGKLGLETEKKSQFGLRIFKRSATEENS